MSKTRIGINGFGRIGRGFVRCLNDDKSAFDLALINDLTDNKTLAHLLKYDSVHGRFGGDVEVAAEGLSIAGDAVKITAIKDPAELPWSEEKVDIVLECTGIFRKRPQAQKHLDAGAKKVIISAPAGDPDATLACGINLDTYDPAKHHILSNASCTTNCLAPVSKVLNDSFGIEHGLMTTIHSYTNDQQILDLPHKDLRRARAAALSMIPTSTGAALALKEVLPALEGKLDGMAIRVPTPNVSIVDLTVTLSKSASVGAVNEAFREAAAGPLKGVLGVSDEPLVSIDYNGNKNSATVDLSETKVIGNMAKVLAWYDNEAGYSQRLFDLAKFVASKL
ncbi:type I glyceraldehyde-3-phosphate dehydrogenase [Haliangium ochraceum]|uniref:Glyceraldehyde-3-phosphate dehydrogenase n=1 Tax=Haliangium ochraceum (strain DSM 14365 / JCM 11303 / SMP-2) TaxID=502025 RepID=D0LTS8_HALO1|nr:type I glyceraldehyde-3-phosphate dehydrogenase [Haliangium ochraceum]ACY15772.1 glyceraldehyde-3-phosphate dehydrogenase, type I [Haliangium ochraceum DSM 14365]